MKPIVILVISANRLLVGNFTLLSKGYKRELDISTHITNFMSSFDPKVALATEPDLILLPVGLPGLDGLETIRAIRAAHFQTPILVSCCCYARADLEELSKYNVQGVITTNDSPEELAAAIYNVVDKQPGLFAQQFQHALQTLPLLTRPGEQSLNARETQILQLIADGLKDKEIAKRLNIGQSSLKNTLHNIYEKLEVKNRTQAVLIAISRGFIRQPPYSKRN